MTDVQKRKILIVDRDLDRAGLIEARLTVRGYTIRLVRTSAEAINLVSAAPFDMLLISAKMEPIGDEALVVKIRKIIYSRYIPIVMIVESNDLSGLLRSVQSSFDDFLSMPCDPLTLELRIQLNMIRDEERLLANPLTRLPGNVVIQEVLKKKIQLGEIFSACYIDIDNFKAYNDAYGFERGDVIIRETANLIRDCANEAQSRDAFVGHIGGDDFLVVLHPDNEEPFAKDCIQKFDKMVLQHYSEADRSKGHVRVLNRKGKNERFPVMTVTVAAATSMCRQFVNPGEIAHITSEVKKYLKTQPGSNYLRDRREKPFEGVDEAVRALQTDLSSNQSPRHEPLGQMLMDSGLLSEADLQRALRDQQKTGKRLGEVLIASNLVSAEQVGRFLEKKLGVSYQSLIAWKPEPKIVRLFTDQFVKEHRVVPMSLLENRLDVAMLDPFDIRMIDQIERNTGFQVAPKLALEEELTIYINRHYHSHE